jgi:AAA+ ATPase superfamily predicted ATPase
MGKTGLILHAFSKFKKNKSIIPVYFDIMATASLHEFAEVFSNAVVRAIAKTEAALKGFLKKMAALRPGLSFDSLTGEPRITLDIRTEKEVTLSLDLIFSLIAHNKHNFVVAIDEFQQIAGYPEKNVEALLRSYIQQTTNVSFIFSGSKKHMLSAMFSQPSRPFFNSTEMMFLSPIDPVEYFEFIRNHFMSRGKTIHEDALNSIAEYTGMHTFYVQFLCNRLFSSFRNITAKEVDITVYQILRENEPVYANYLNLMTLTQYRTLRAIALEKVTESPTSSWFLKKYGLDAPSTVAQAVESLTGKEFIQEDSGRLCLQDKFFAEWIRNKNR